MNTKWLDQTNMSEVNLVGGKNASLGEMLQNLTNLGINIPNGFVVTAIGFDNFISNNNISQQIDNIINAIENEFNNKHVQLLEDKQLIKSNINRDAKVIQTVQILTGCLGAPCTYCKTIFARGKLVSFPLNDIKKRVEFLVNNGTKIIYLTSQDNAVYGMDINSNLPTLLNELLSIPGDFKIRLGMGNPDHYMLYKKELVEIFKNDKMFKFFHIPIQSGSNKILTHMRRGYTIEHFNEIYDEIKLEIPDLVFATDIICGFPYEDENDFNQTLEIVNKCKFDVINISKFYPRLGTLAAEYEQLHNDIKKERSKELSLLHNKIAFENKLKYMDKELNVIVEAKNGNDLICRTDNYTQVIVKDNSEIKIGESFKVKIIETSTWHLIGVLI